MDKRVEAGAAAIMETGDVFNPAGRERIARAVLTAADAAAPQAAQCAPTETVCLRCRNDITKCDGVFQQAAPQAPHPLPAVPADWFRGMPEPYRQEAWRIKCATPPAQAQQGPTDALRELNSLCEIHAKRPKVLSFSAMLGRWAKKHEVEIRAALQAAQRQEGGSDA